MRKAASSYSSILTTGAFASALRSLHSDARPSCAPACATPASMRSSFRPKRIWRMQSCALPICASAAVSWPRAAACRHTSENSVKFLWPEMLWLLLALPLLVVAYIIVLRRRKKAALRYASLSIVKEAIGAGQSFRRHVPPLLLLLALIMLLFAMSRPLAVVTLPSQHETVILAMDVSGSMRATDVQPNRLVAAQAAAKAFVAGQPRNPRIGVVSVAGTAALVQPPTRNREDIVATIDRFQLQRGTAIGSGIIVSLATLFPDDGIDVSSMIYGRESRRSASLDQPRKADKKDVKPVAPGSYNAAA